MVIGLVLLALAGGAAAGGAEPGHAGTSAAETGRAVSAPSQNAPSLAGSEWRPVRLGEAGAVDESGPTEIFVRFEGDGRLAGHGGCNRFFGGYTITGTAIEIGPLGATRMMCPEPAMAGEAALFEILQTARRFERRRTELSLFDAEGREIARFVQSDWD